MDILKLLNEWFTKGDVTLSRGGSARTENRSKEIQLTVRHESPYARLQDVFKYERFHVVGSLA